MITKYLYDTNRNLVAEVHLSKRNAKAIIKFINPHEPVLERDVNELERFKSERNLFYENEIVQLG